MFVHVKKYSEGFLSVKFPYSMENVEKIRKVSGRKWLESDKIWIVPDNRDTVNLLSRLFGTENIILEDFEFSKDTITLIKNELKLRNYSLKTQKAYLGHVRRFLQYYGKSVDAIDKDDVKKYLLRLVYDDKSPAYIDQAVSALRFLYVDVNKHTDIDFDVSRPKREQKLPSVLNSNEVLRIIQSIDNIKHKSIIMLIYSAGLRVSESANMKICDIDSQRKLIFVRAAKGKKDRYTLLSKETLEILRQYVRVYKPKVWLFPGQKEDYHITTRSIQKVFESAALKAGIKKKVSIHTLRHPYVKYTPKNNLVFSYLHVRSGITVPAYVAIQ